MEQLLIINRFLEINKIVKTCQIVEFWAIVDYVEHSISDISKVQMKLDSFRYGDIEVYPTDKIDMAVLHTGFSAPYNDYLLDNQTLVIKGQASPGKGGKKYTVRITPIG